MTQRGQHGFDATTNTQTDPRSAAPDRRRSLLSTIALLLVISTVSQRENARRIVDASSER